MRRAPLTLALLCVGATARAGGFGDGVTVRVTKLAGGPVVSFGLPLPPHAVADARSVQVSASGAPVPARVEEILGEHDAAGRRVGARAVLVQLDASLVPPDGRLAIAWRGGSAATARARIAYKDVSSDSPETVDTASRTIAMRRGVPALVETHRERRVLYVGREPRWLVTYTEGYLAATRLLGAQVTAAEAHRGPHAGLGWLSDALAGFTRSAMHHEAYPLDPDPDSVPDPRRDYEGWLYDRCATFLVAYTHLGDVELLRHGLRACSWYAGAIDVDGPEGVRGLFLGKPEADPKYSHLRGLYAYFALTGDERALAAGRAIGDLWERDRGFVAPYRAGHTRGRDRLWTERLLATSLEGLYYAHRLTGERRYLDAFRELFATAYRHVTGDRATLAAINPGVDLPPQDCFIHTAEQQGEGDRTQPWCSPWMSELVVDPLLRYQEQTGDPRVDEVFLRLGRFLRDTGTAYFRGYPLDDRFLAPSRCDDPRDVENRRRLIPVYGAGRDATGRVRHFPEFDDTNHCADATTLVAAALRALRRSGGFDQHPIGPFASEGESLVALHAELASCAARVFVEQSRPARDPATWNARSLAPGLADPAAFLRAQKIGWPSHALAPARRLSWWFNGSMEQFSLLDEAGVPFARLRSGFVRGPACK